MPGNTVKYPQNAMGPWFQERLSRDGLEGSRFRVGDLKLNLPGSYRPLLAAPRNLRYQLQRAARKGQGGGEVTGESSKRDSQLNASSSSSAEDKQGSLALLLNFDLDSSCYATICLREIMKCEF